MKRFILIFLSAFVCSIYSATPNYQPDEYQRKIIVVIPSYNNYEWCVPNLISLFVQEYDNYEILVIDDCSTDGTYERMQQLVEDYGQGHRTTILRNEKRMGAMANWYKAIHMCPDDAIIFQLDGDDWLATIYALRRINQEYADPNVWMTYGQYKDYPSENVGFCQALPDDVIERNAYRKWHWVTSHPRTFYAWLFKKIKKEDFLYEETRDFYPMTCDQAIMFPLLELAGKHSRFIPDVLYVYNRDNPINDEKIDVRLSFQCERAIRGSQSYHPLKSRWDA